MWAAQEVTARLVDEGTRTEARGAVFLVFGSVFAAASVVIVMLAYFALSSRAQMSVNALASWSVEPNYAGFLRMRFTPDEIRVEVHGIDDIKTEKPNKIWRRKSGHSPLHPEIDPLWDRSPLVHVDEFRVTR